MSKWIKTGRKRGRSVASKQIRTGDQARSRRSFLHFLSFFQLPLSRSDLPFEVKGTTKFSGKLGVGTTDATSPGQQKAVDGVKRYPEMAI